MMLAAGEAPERSEFEELLAGILEGPPDAEQNERFCALLRYFPELQDDYADLMQLHALLLWRNGRVIPHGSLEYRECEPDGPFEVADPPVPAENAPAARSWRARVGKAAAVVGFGMALGVLINLCFMPSPGRDSGPEVVSQLVGWNLDIAQAPTPGERRVIHDARAETMHGLLAGADLVPEDRDLAQTLVETGAWLTANDDPVAEAERFSDIADQLLARLDSASAANDPRRAISFADSYQRITEVGISINLDKAVTAGEPDPRHTPKLDRLIAGDDRRAKKVDGLLARHPDASWKSIHHALKGHRHKPGNALAK